VFEPVFKKKRCQSRYLSVHYRINTTAAVAPPEKPRGSHTLTRIFREIKLKQWYRAGSGEQSDRYIIAVWRSLGNAHSIRNHVFSDGYSGIFQNRKKDPL